MFTWECITIRSLDGPFIIFLLHLIGNYPGQHAIQNGARHYALRQTILVKMIVLYLQKNITSEYYYYYHSLPVLILLLSKINIRRRKVLEMQKGNGLDDMGPIKWELALCVFAVFLLVYFSLWKGVKSTGKVSIFPLSLLLESLLFTFNLRFSLSLSLF